MKCGGDVSIGDLKSLKPSPSQQHLYLHLFRPRMICCVKPTNSCNSSFLIPMAEKRFLALGICRISSEISALCFQNISTGNRFAGIKLVCEFTSRTKSRRPGRARRRQTHARQLARAQTRQFRLRPRHQARIGCALPETYRKNSAWRVSANFAAWRGGLLRRCEQRIPLGGGPD